MPGIDPRDLAARYGWALSVINSSPELKALFNRAVAGVWAPDRFVAELRNTAWYRKHSDTWRQNEVLKRSDPATWSQRFAQNRSSIAAMASQMGVVWSSQALTNVVNSYMMFGWNDAQLKAVMGKYVNFTHGSFTGQAGDLEDELRQFAVANGVQVSDGWLLSNIRGISTGNLTIQQAKDRLRDYAVTAFPGWEKDLRAGKTMEDIASPYKEAMSRILEVNPAQVNIFDPTIRKALMNGAPEPKVLNSGTANSAASKTQPTSTPLWQFEQQLRSDPRWLKTKNAEDSVMGVAHKVLQDFGFKF